MNSILLVGCIKWNDAACTCDLYTWLWKLCMCAPTRRHIVHQLCVSVCFWYTNVKMHFYFCILYANFALSRTVCAQIRLAFVLAFFFFCFWTCFVCASFALCTRIHFVRLTGNNIIDAFGTYWKCCACAYSSTLHPYCCDLFRSGNTAWNWCTPAGSGEGWEIELLDIGFIVANILL